MNKQFDRLSQWAGVAFFVLFVGGILLATGPQFDIKQHDTPAVVAHRVFKAYGKSGNRVLIIIGAYLMVLSALALVWFVHGLRDRILTVGSGSLGVARFVVGLGITAAGAILVSALAFAAVPGSKTFGNQPLPTNADSIVVIQDLAFAMLVVAFGLTIAALVLTVTIGEWRSALLPKWLRYAGILGVLGGVLTVGFFPLALPILWLLGVAIVGITRPTPPLAPAVDAVSRSQAVPLS